MLKSHEMENTIFNVTLKVESLKKLFRATSFQLADERGLRSNFVATVFNQDRQHKKTFTKAHSSDTKSLIALT